MRRPSVDHVARLGAAAESNHLVVLAALVVANWAVVAYEALHRIHHDGWLYHHGGDATWYWSIAEGMTHLELPRTAVGYGASLLQAPVALVVGPNFVAGLPFIVLLNTLVLGPLAMVALHGIGTRIAGRLFGLWCCLLWVVVPPAVIHLYRESNREVFVDAFLPVGRGLNGLSDYPSLVCVLCAAYLLLRATDSRSWRDAALAGLTVGFLLGLKPSNALFLPAALILIAATRSLRAVGAFAAALVPALVTLTIFKHTGLGVVPLFEGSRQASGGVVAALDPWNRYVDLDWGHLATNRDALREVFGSVRIFELVLLGGTAALALWSPVRAGFTAVWFLAYFVVKGTSPVTNVYAASFFRLLEPAYPAFLLLGASLVLAVPVGRARRRAFAARVARLRVVAPVSDRRLAAAAVALGLLPFLVVVLCRPAPAGAFAEDTTQGATVPVTALGFRARPQPGAVALSWHSQAASGVQPTYHIFRDRTDGCTYLPFGALDCFFEMTELRQTPDTTFTNYDVHGDWTYRVGVYADYTGSRDTSDLLLLSDPVHVHVP